MSAAALSDLVAEWLRLDRNETTRKEIEALVARNDNDELERRMRYVLHYDPRKLTAIFSKGNELNLEQLV
ncbi:hypothetical protein BC835DRAFT_1371479 [Cytidiella melzeri]|nr:hypothetical protein BC835DRAFT_1371479 [Cytidiella melzeri]